MSVFAISDLHLSLNSSTNKSMEVFGRRWQGYVNKLENNWRALVSEEDTVILAGDISWALSTEEAKEDFVSCTNSRARRSLAKETMIFGGKQ